MHRGGFRLSIALLYLSIMIWSTPSLICLVEVIYIFRHFHHYIFTEFNKNNNEEERSSGTTGTGVSQKDLQISEKTKEEEKC